MNLVVFIMKSIKEQVEYLRDFVVDEKNALFDRLIQERTDYVTVVLEDLFQSHNQSAVMLLGRLLWDTTCPPDRKPEFIRYDFHSFAGSAGLVVYSPA